MKKLELRRGIYLITVKYDTNIFGALAILYRFYLIFHPKWSTPLLLVYRIW
ncbi:unnamed protein product [Musa acuminata subsp. burmannicoides]